jgi:type IV secretion system protein VirB1
MLLCFVIAVIMLLCAIPVATLAAPLSQTQFALLASRCAPAMPGETLEAVARTESGLDPLVLHDNTTGQHEKAGSLGAAVAEADEWVGHGNSVDIGLMQVNSANLAPLGMTVADALDPCISLAGGAAVLRAAYGDGNTQAEQQVALLMALSRYNTGTPFKGIVNGYVRTVLENVGKVAEARPIPLSPGQTPIFVDPNAPPSWNVSATGAYAQRHGASWIIDLAPSPAPAGALPDAPRSTAAPERLAAPSIASFSTPPTSR